MVIPENIKTNEGFDLAEMANQNPVLLVFLRHFGCIFCKEALYDIGKIQDYLKENSVDIVFVHMDTPEQAEYYFEQFQLHNVQHISDSDCNLYIQFGLRKGSISQLYGLRTWIRGFEANKKGLQYGLNKHGDTSQMPGIFVLCDGKVKNSFIHNNISDLPDYMKLLECCID